MKTTKQLLNEIAFQYWDRKAQEQLQRLLAVAQAAQVLAENADIEQLPGGKDLVTAIKFLE
ncbi:hypothetical protein A6S26_05115 [Nostoc sp. ATCC 43529]|nr:hypothetical protein A6S26_05115 [Nostoc sp. ATCC 43529]